MFNLGSSPGSASYGRDKNTSWKIQQLIQTETVFCSWNYFWLLERKRGSKEKSPNSDMTQCRVLWNATLAPWEFAIVQVFVGVMVVLAQTFSGLCQRLLETEVSFNLSHSVSEWTKMYSTKYLREKKTLSRNLLFCVLLEKAEFLFSLQCPQWKIETGSTNRMKVNVTSIEKNRVLKKRKTMKAGFNHVLKQKVHKSNSIDFTGTTDVLCDCWELDLSRLCATFSSSREPHHQVLLN